MGGVRVGQLLKQDPDTDSYHVLVPPEVLPIIGERVEETRMYVKWGSGEDFANYMNFLGETYGGLVSPGGAAQIAGVSRAAVHKRMKAGKLTAFLFHTSIKRKNAKVTPFCHIPVIEVKAWRQEIVERTETRMDALSIKKKDWNQDFLTKSIREAKRELQKRGIKTYDDSGVV